MGDIWKNMKEKVDGVPVGPSYASDWEAMNQKIEAQPALSKPKRRGGFWFKTAAIVLLLALSGISAIWLWPDGSTTADGERGTRIQEENSSEVHSASEAIIADEEQNIEPFTKRKSDVSNDVAGQEADVVEPKNNTVNSPANSSIGDSLTYVAPAVAGSSQKADARDKNEGVKSDIIMNRTPNTVLSVDVNDHPDDEQPAPAQSSEEEVLVLAPGTLIEENFTEPQYLDEPFNEYFGDNQKITSANIPDDGKDEQFSTRNIAEATSTEKDTANAEDEEEVALTDTEGTLAKQSPFQPEEKAITRGLKESGFRLTTLSAGGIFLTDYTENTMGYGGGISVDWQKNAWLINTGLNYTQYNYQTEKVSFSDFHNYDTSLVKTYENRQVSWVDSIWVIRGPGIGGYVYDTNSRTVTDTLIKTLIDTSSITTKNIERQVVKVSYLELPVLVGHRFRFNKVGVDIYVGAILNQTLFVSNGDGEVQKSFGVDLMLQPAIRYYIVPEFSIYIRAGLRYGLSGDAFRSEKLYSSFQLGLSYHW